VKIEPVAGHIGAEISGVDLKEPLGEEVAEALRAALAQYLVIFFRDQPLDIPSQKRVTEVFGPVLRVPYVQPSKDDPDVVAGLKEAEERKIYVFGGDWHSDFSFLEQPPAGSVLAAVEIPPYGGDTLWSSQVAAWETLPDDLRAAVEGRNAIHVGAPHGTRYAPPKDMAVSKSIKMQRGDPAADEERPHPIGRRHVTSGRTALFVNPIYSVRIEGMSVEESRPILQRLYAHAVRPEFPCRFRWSPGAVAIWDNRATLHYAINDYDGSRRLLHRTTFAGERPV